MMLVVQARGSTHRTSQYETVAFVLEPTLHEF